jgi:proline dehydrogenase
MALFDRLIALSLPLVPKPFVRSVASRYIAGETSDEAIRAAANLNKLGIRATMDVLGEDIYNIEQARAAAWSYERLLEDIHRHGIDSNISIKLTQFGLKIDQNVCLELTSRLVQRAKDLSNFVRIDMEDSSCTSDTLRIYRELRREHSNVGVVIQAYLRRTLEDVAALEYLKPNYRLCKGVYIEPRKIAFRDMRIINRNYIMILERLLRNGSHVGIATHDELIVWEAMRLIGELRIPPTMYEFQMLLGVDEELRGIIHSAGHPIRVYIPFGRDWYAYSVRRLRENPKLAGYVLKAMFK